MGFVDVMKYAMGLPGIRRIVPSIVGRYETYVTKELRKFGLFYDDLFNENEEEIKRVLAILPEDELVMRHRRIRRAFDISTKKTYLHPDLQKEVDVFHPYIRSRLPLVKRQMLEESSYRTD